MKICFPVSSDEGLKSQVFGHFGSAPKFIMVDTEADSVSELINKDLNHTHGACSPLKALGGSSVDAVIVGGIGAGAIRGLQSSGVKVYMASAKTVGENVELLKDGMLDEMNGSACSGHSHSHSHSHGGSCCH